MNKKLTYIEARDKIWNAYFRDEIDPWNSNFCFCGSLAPNEFSFKGYKNWNNHDQEFRPEKHPYTLNEYAQMEIALFKHVGGMCSVIGHRKFGTGSYAITKYHSAFEEKLFSGMLAALEVLKSIHKSRGELIPEDETIATKRDLKPIKVK